MRLAVPNLLHWRTVFRKWKSWDLEREELLIEIFELLTVILSLIALILAAIHLGLAIGQRNRD